MKKGYCLAVLIFLMINSMALTASAVYTTNNTAPTDYPSVTNSQEHAANQVSSAQQQVTLTLYVLDGGVNGPCFQELRLLHMMQPVRVLRV
jgi:peptidoglycan hydrolase CwlO-like protein